MSDTSNGLHLQVLLDGIVQQPDGCIWDLPLLTAEDSQQIELIRGVPSQLLPSGVCSAIFACQFMSSL